MTEHIERGTVFPSAEAQTRYPLADYPCRYCANPSTGLPCLVDHSSEFYWHHWKSRVGCKRFGTSEFCGSRPRPGTAVATYNLAALAEQERLRT